MIIWQRHGTAKRMYVYTVTFHLYTLPSSFLHIYSIYTYVVDFIDGMLYCTAAKLFQPQIPSLFHRGGDHKCQTPTKHRVPYLVKGHGCLIDWVYDIAGSHRGGGGDYRLFVRNASVYICIIYLLPS